MNFMVSTAALVAASACVSNEETRYYLCGVAVQPHPQKGVLCIATDGHRMMVVHDEAGYTPRNLILSLNWKLKDLKPAARDVGVRTLCFDLPDEDRGGTFTAQIKKLCSYGADERYEGGQMAAATAVTIIDGTFPDWTRVVPWDTFGKIGTVGHVAFNPGYIKPFGDAFGILGPERGLSSGGCIQLACTEPGNPFLVTEAGIHNAFGVLMPKRTDASTEPVWLSPLKPAQKEAA